MIGDTLINQAFGGYNSTLFTYGANGTGKTTVLYGSKNEPGVVSFILTNLFKVADQDNEESSFRCEIR